MAEALESANGREFLYLLKQISGTVAQIEKLSVDRSRSTVFLMRCAAFRGLRILQPDFRDQVRFLAWSLKNLLATCESAFEQCDLSTDSKSEVSASSDVFDSGLLPTFSERRLNQV